jgi:hypothetical protein
MADAAQADRDAALADTSLGSVPMRSSALSAGEHGLGLLAQRVNVSDVRGTPASLKIIDSCHSLGFGFFAESEPFIPAALKLEETV